MRKVMTQSHRWMRRCCERAGIEHSQVPVRLSKLLPGLHPLQLLQHIRRRQPSGFDDNYFEELQLASLGRATPPIGPDDLACDLVTLSGPATRVQYIGGVQGERSVVADESFPVVTRGGGQRARHAGQTLPFIMPIARTGQGFEFIPSVVAYFEVTVEHPHPSWPPAPGSCVAVGICNQHFPLATTLPGWDTNSYGWHSDDGHVFHASGHGAPFAERFQPGDVVGCGIDMLPCLPTDDAGFSPSAARIFFTRNGRMEGYAFDELDVSRPWFPVVGLDSPCPVSLNTGTDHARPFAFPLASFVRQQWQIYATTHPVILAVARGRMPMMQARQLPLAGLSTASLRKSTPLAGVWGAGTRLAGGPIGLRDSHATRRACDSDGTGCCAHHARARGRFSSANLSRWSSWRGGSSAGVSGPAPREPARRAGERSSPSRPLAGLCLADLLLHARQAACKPPVAPGGPLLVRGPGSARVVAMAGRTVANAMPLPSRQAALRPPTVARAGAVQGPTLGVTARVSQERASQDSAPEGARAALALATMVRLRLRLAARNAEVHTPTAGAVGAHGRRAALAAEPPAPRLPGATTPRQERVNPASATLSSIPASVDSTVTTSTAEQRRALSQRPAPPARSPPARSRRRWRLMPEVAHAELGWTGTGALRPAVLARAVQLQEEETEIRQRRQLRRQQRRGEWTAAVLSSLHSRLQAVQRLASGTSTHRRHDAGEADTAAGEVPDAAGQERILPAEPRTSGPGHATATGGPAAAAATFASSAAAAIRAASQPLQDALVERLQSIIPMLDSSSDSEAEGFDTTHAAHLLTAPGQSSADALSSASSAVHSQPVLRSQSEAATGSRPASAVQPASAGVSHSDPDLMLVAALETGDAESLAAAARRLLLATQAGSEDSGATSALNRDHSVTRVLEVVAEAISGAATATASLPAGTPIHELGDDSSWLDARRLPQVPPPSPLLSAGMSVGTPAQLGGSRGRALSPSPLRHSALSKLDLGRRDDDSDASDLCDDVPTTPAWLADGDTGGAFARQAVTGRVERPSPAQPGQSGDGFGRGNARIGSSTAAASPAGAAAAEAPASTRVASTMGTARAKASRHRSPLSRAAGLATGHTAVPANGRGGCSSSYICRGVGPTDHVVSPPWVRAGGSLVDLSGAHIAVDSDGEY